MRGTWVVEIIHGEKLETRQILERKELDETEARRLFENASLLPGAIWRSLWYWQEGCGQLVGCGWLNLRS